MTLCLPWNTKNEFFRDSLKTYPRYDVAITTDFGSLTHHTTQLIQLGSHLLIPVDRKVIFNQVTFCAAGINLTTNTTYYFVMRFEGTPQYIDDLNRQPWTSEELAYIGGTI